MRWSVGSGANPVLTLRGWTAATTNSSRRSRPLPMALVPAYEFVPRTLASFDYHLLGYAERGFVRAYVGKVCGFSPEQMRRLIRHQAETGAVDDRPRHAIASGVLDGPRPCFASKNDLQSIC